MKPKLETCDLNRIARFLDDALPVEETVAFEAHLDKCGVCRQRLSDSAAEPNWWTDAGELLREKPFDADSDATSAGDAHSLRALEKDAIDAVVAMLDPTDDPRMLGRLGGYEIAGVVGAGGMGVVLKAFDSNLNRYVALKALTPHLATSAAARRRFAREAQAAAAVVHDNVIAIHAVADSGKLPFLVMPYLRGQSLQRRLDDRGPLPLVEILRIGMQTAAGLAAAHAQGLVHRDVKPANIMLDDGTARVTITDFGLARAIDDATVTQSGVIVGTPQFMSPEQARGEPVDTRSDLFSLGSVLYTACTGRPPFRAESTMGVLRRISDQPARPIREIVPETPAWLERLIERLHAKEPGGRYADAAQVADLFEHCLAHVQQPTAIPLPSELLIPKPPKTHLTVGFTGASRRTMPIALVILFAAIAWFAPRPSKNADTDSGQQNPIPLLANPQPQTPNPDSASSITADAPPLNDAALIRELDDLNKDLDRLESEILSKGDKR